MPCSTNARYACRWELLGIFCTSLYHDWDCGLSRKVDPAHLGKKIDEYFMNKICFLSLLLVFLSILFILFLFSHSSNNSCTLVKNPESVRGHTEVVLEPYGGRYEKPNEIQFQPENTALAHPLLSLFSHSSH